MKLKLKFIFNIGKGPARPAFRPRVAYRRPLCALFVLTLAVLIALLVPAAAQQQALQTTAQADAPAANPADPPDNSTESLFPHFKDTRFWLSGQANFIFQTHPEFRAPYSGVHSLNPQYEKATSRVFVKDLSQLN